MFNTDIELDLFVFELRSLGYGILKKIFYSEPQLEFIKEISDNSIIQTFPFNDLSLPIEEGVELIIQELENNKHSLDLYFEKIHCDYTRMFIGPDLLLAPPWESTYFNDSRLIFQEQTFQVREKYLKYNFVPNSYPNEPDDHIGFELDFIHKLSILSLDRNELKDNKQLKILLKDQKQFIDQHLIRWIGLLAENINKFSETDFYKGFALILVGFITIDIEIIEELLSKL